MGSEAEVVREKGWTVNVDGSPVAWFAYPDHALRWANQNYHGRHQIIPSESPATKRGERSFTERGFENYCEIIDERGRTVTVRESSQMGEGWVWIFCQDASGADGQMHLGKWQSYSPHLSIDNARDVVDGLNRWIADQESPCSSGSQGGSQGGGNGSGAASGGTTNPSTPSTTTPAGALKDTNAAPNAAVASNPPAWATPQIVAACKPGERLRRTWHTPEQVRAYPSMRMWEKGVDKGVTALAEEYHDSPKDELYVIPTPPPDKPKPEAKCDGRGILRDVSKPMGSQLSDCPGCPACKPKPDDAEEVARKILSNTYVPRDGRAMVQAATEPDMIAYVVDIIRADRAKHADLAGKVRVLCNGAILAMSHRDAVALAREVLAMMEER